MNWKHYAGQAVAHLAGWTVLLTMGVVFLWALSERGWEHPGRPPVPERGKAAAEVLELGRAVDAEVTAYHDTLDLLLTDERGRRVASDSALVKRYRRLRGEDTRAKRAVLGDIVRRAGELQQRGDAFSAPYVNGRGESLTPEEELHRMKVKLLEIRSRYQPLRRELDDILGEAAKAGTPGRCTLEVTLGYGY